MDKIVRGVTINDLHFGIAQTERVYHELLDVFIPFIEKTDFDILNINGDYFQRKLSLAEPAAIYAMSLFNKIVEICIKKHIKLRIIQGTLSHDRNQNELFSAFAQPGLDMKFIQTVQEEDICGLHVLYIPEEYPEDAGKYYGSFKEKQYNIIHGHGAWDFVSFNSMIEKSDRTDVRTAPVFKWNEWSQTVPNGFITFGHIHGRNVYKKKIFYSGAFSAWGFDEISKRGFTYYEYNLDQQTYTVKFIDNDEVPTYKIESVADFGFDIKTAPVEWIQQAINLHSKNFDFYRIDLSGMPLDKIEILKKVYKNNPKIKTDVKDKVVLLHEDTTSDIYNKYNYILSDNLSVPKVISRYIKEELNCDMNEEKIKEIITDNDN